MDLIKKLQLLLKGVVFGLLSIEKSNNFENLFSLGSR